MYSGKGFGVKFRAPCCCIGGWSGDTGNVDEVCSWPIGRRTPTAARRAKVKIPSTARLLTTIPETAPTARPLREVAVVGDGVEVGIKR